MRPHSYLTLQFPLQGLVVVPEVSVAEVILNESNKKEGLDKFFFGVGVNASLDPNNGNPITPPYFIGEETEGNENFGN